MPNSNVKKSLEELLLHFDEIWEAYWNSKGLEGPTQKELARAYEPIKKEIKRPNV